MTPALLPYLMCPVTKAPLRLSEAEMEPTGRITSGWLISTTDSNHRYPVIKGIPRFIPPSARAALEEVRSFGDQWNFFDFEKFREDFEQHTIGNTFGGLGHFNGKLVVDAGAGSGMQTRWLAESGAAHVIALELSHAVDGAIARNTAHLPNVDIIQCSIDNIPIRSGCVPGVIMCMNVIQHTRSVPATLQELWRIAAPGTELAWNTYLRHDSTLFQRKRHTLYRAVRELVAAMPFSFRLAYAHTMAALRMVPLLGWLLEKMHLVRVGPVPETFHGKERYKQRYRAAVLKTFDYYGAHTHQHHHTFAEIQGMVATLQPAATVLNTAKFFTIPQPPDILLRLKK